MTAILPKNRLKSSNGNTAPFSRDRARDVELSELCRDTRAYIAVWRGDLAMGREIESAGWIGVSTLALGELEGGFMNGSLLEFDRKRLNRFLKDPFIRNVSADRKAADQYGRIYFYHRKSGRPIPHLFYIATWWVAHTPF